jgi:hypothetical protein
MSLVVVMQVANGDVVIAADRRGTIGDPRGLVALDECVRKLIPFGVGAALGIVGMPSAVLRPVQQALADINAGRPREDIVGHLSDLLKEHYRVNFGLRPFITDKPIQDARPQVAVVYADRRRDGKGLFVLPSEVNFAPLPVGRPYVMAGVSQYALYLYQRLWREDLSAQQAARLAALLVCETSKLDPKVGPLPDIMILEEERTLEFGRGDVENMMRENEERIGSLARSFKEGGRP